MDLSLSNIVGDKYMDPKTSLHQQSECNRHQIYCNDAYIIKNIKSSTPILQSDYMDRHEPSLSRTSLNSMTLSQIILSTF